MVNGDSMWNTRWKLKSNWKLKPAKGGNLWPVQWPKMTHGWLFEGSCKVVFETKNHLQSGSRFEMSKQCPEFEHPSKWMSALSRKLMFSRVSISVKHCKGHKSLRCKGKFSDLSVQKLSHVLLDVHPSDI